MQINLSTSIISFRFAHSFADDDENGAKDVCHLPANNFISRALLKRWAFGWISETAGGIATDCRSMKKVIGMQSITKEICTNIPRFAPFRHRRYELSLILLRHIIFPSDGLDDCLSLFSDWFENWYLPATIRTFTESERKLKSIIPLRLASPRGNCFSFHLIIAFLRLHSAEDDMFGPSICLFGCDIETDLLLSIRDGWLRFIMGSVASVSRGRKRTFQCCPTSIT